MALITVMLLALLGMVIFGGLVARRTLAGVNLASVPGALLGCLGFCQFVLYCFAVVPVFILLAFATIDPETGHTSSLVTHSFELTLDEMSLQVSDFYGNLNLPSEVTKLQAELRLTNLDGVATFLLISFVIVLWLLLFFTLRNAEAVLRSLYERTPFVEENPKRLRQIASLLVAIWLAYCVYVFAMTTYIQSQITIIGGELAIIDLPVAMPLISAGLLIVLAEVFRVGYELKQENEFTV